MKPPRKLRTGHSTWQIRPADPHIAKLLDDDGSLLASERWLNYNADLNPDRTREVIVHESLHAVIDSIGGIEALGFRIENKDEDEERLVSLLTGPMLALLRDNPLWVRYVTAKDE